MSDAAVVCSNLSFSWPDDTPVFHDLSFTVPTGRTRRAAPTRPPAGPVEPGPLRLGEINGATFGGRARYTRRDTVGTRYAGSRFV